MDVNQHMEQMGKQAQQAARLLRHLPREHKDRFLQHLAQRLEAETSTILAANARDMAAATHLDAAMRDRLQLTPERIQGIAADVRNVASLADPVGEVFDERTLPENLQIHRQRVPLGVVGVIYEARPNVTVDIAALCLKSGNASILRGGKETVYTNQALLKVLQHALQDSDLPAHAIQLIEDPDRQWVHALLRLDRYVDMIIPRGGAGLHRFCLENSTIPVITGGIGVCHLYVDQGADLAAAVPVIENAKVQRPTVCNALDTLLVHEAEIEALCVQLAPIMAKAGVALHADEKAHAHLQALNYPHLKKAEAEDFGTEFLALVLSLKTVPHLEAALDHIAAYSSGHSDGILTQNQAHARRFQQDVDSAAVYVNASTRFTDGAQFGLGAEVAVSTQKLHARGPMALEGLTTYKWLITGQNSIRP